MEASALQKLFRSNEKVVTITQPSHAIQHTLKQAEKDDFIAIIGSHYWAPVLCKELNISFDIEKISI